MEAIAMGNISSDSETSDNYSNLEFESSLSDSEGSDFEVKKMLFGTKSK
jgi:hypothetical protein